MNKYIILIISSLLIFFNNSFAQVGKKENDTLINYIDINKKKQGKWVKRYDNGKIKYKGFFINDKPQGTFTYYHANGKIKAILNYDENNFATTEMYWKNGNNAAKGFYNDLKKRIKTWKIYYEDGSLSAIINYNNNGKADGEVKMYYPGINKILLHCFYKNGKKDGHYIKYFKSGLIQEEGDYKDNKKIGNWKMYSPEGILEEEGPYVAGQKHGKWLIYSESEGVDTINYQNGRQDNYDEIMEEWRKKEEWARENQDKFKQPEDYLDNPIEFFKPSNVKNPYETKKTAP